METGTSNKVLATTAASSEASSGTTLGTNSRAHIRETYDIEASSLQFRQDCRD